MAEEKEIILSVDTGQAESRLAQVQRQITELTKAKKELKKQYDAGKVGAEDYAVANETFAKGLALLKGEYKTLTAEATKNVSVNASLGDSYNEVASRVAQLQKQYKALSASQRESAEGKALLKNISDQKQALKDIDYTMGDFQRNVGNYPKAMAGAFSPLDGILQNVGTSVEELANDGMGALQNGISKTGKALVNFGKVLVTSPIGLVIAALTALVAVTDNVSEAFKRSDDAGTKWDRGMASLSALTKKGKEQWNAWADAIGGVIDKLGEWYAIVSDDAKQARQLVTDIDNLQEAERAQQVASAKTAQEVSELRAKVAEKDKYTAEERRQYLEQAIALEQKNLEEQTKIAEERLRLEIEQNKQNADTSDEAKDRENKLRVELIRLQTDYNNKKREFSAQRVEINNQITANEKATADELRRRQEERTRVAKEQAEKRAEEEAKALEERKRLASVELQIVDELEKALLANQQEGFDKRREQARIAYEDEIQALQEKYGKEKELSAQAQEQLQALLRAKEEAYKAQQAEIDAEEIAKVAEVERQKAEAVAMVEDEIYNQRKEAGLVKEEEAKAYEDEKFAQELETMRLRLEEKGVSEEEIQRLINEKKTAQAEAQAQKEEEIEKQKSIAVANQMATSLNAFGSVLDGVEKLAGAFAKDDEERAKMSKVLAIGKIAVQTGIALAQGIASAQSVPFPANIGAIATTITSVMTGIASAIASVNGAKFATGGIVGGTSYTGDNVPVLVNSGEMILNQGQQARLFELANGYGASNIEALAGAMAYAVSQQPAPVVVYDEFNAFGAKVAQINEMTTFNL